MHVTRRHPAVDRRPGHLRRRRPRRPRRHPRHPGAVRVRPVGATAARAVDAGHAGLLCLLAAVAALAATGIAHLLIVSTPDPLSYLGWIIGLGHRRRGRPAAARWHAAIAVAVVNLVIGLAIGSLVIGTAMSARKPATR